MLPVFRRLKMSGLNQKKKLHHLGECLSQPGCKGVGLSTDSTEWDFVASPLETLPSLKIEWGWGENGGGTGGRIMAGMQNEFKN